MPLIKGALEEDHHCAVMRLLRHGFQRSMGVTLIVVVLHVLL